MKLIYRYCLFTLACCGYACTAQRGIVKVYVYQRSVAPGTVPTVISENGGVKERAIKGSFYRYIYLEHKNSVKDIVPLKVWIGQQPYSVDYQEIKATPVIVGRGSDPQKDTVVPATTNAIMQVIPRQALTNDSLPSALKETIEQNELVILYSCGKKTRHVAVRQLKNLSSFILQ